MFIKLEIDSPPRAKSWTCPWIASAEQLRTSASDFSANDFPEGRGKALGGKLRLLHDWAEEAESTSAAVGTPEQHLFVML